MSEGDRTEVWPGGMPRVGQKAERSRKVEATDIETVGAGGGSIAWFDRDGLLKVGPVSAGAEPGPACYARGGERPTVTDANLLLGRLSSRGLLDGEMALDVDRARAAYEPLARELGFAPERTAHGVLGIVVGFLLQKQQTRQRRTRTSCQRILGSMTGNDLGLRIESC